MDLECEICGSYFQSKSSLNNHKKTANYCLKISHQTDSLIESHENFKFFKCCHCSKEFGTNFNLSRHIKTCKSREINDLKKQILLYEGKISELNKLVEDLKTENNEYKIQLADNN